MESTLVLVEKGKKQWVSRCQVGRPLETKWRTCSATSRDGAMFTEPIREGKESNRFKFAEKKVEVSKIDKNVE